MKIEVKRKFMVWYYVLRSANGQVLATSEMYAKKANARRAALKLGAAIKAKVA